MKAISMAIVSVLLGVGMVVPVIQAETVLLPTQGHPIVITFIRSGTIESIDPTGLTVTILNDLGQKESLPVTKESVFVGLIQGDRVVCEMNEDGKVTKIVKATTIPESSPAPDPRG